ncbi:hypothetical protein [Ensifer aridi]|uniref:hypothetical protein n=1 Tax=Ensifer aridi TaxID=1708715 RepID=UPI000A110E83|nr:hypothetical protein [Ensifer aridi]
MFAFLAALGRGRQYAIGAVGGFLIFSAVNALSWLPAAKEEGAKIARSELDSATNKSIGELRDEASGCGSHNRRLWIERGRLYVNATGQCVERPAQPGG